MDSKRPKIEVTTLIWAFLIATLYFSSLSASSWAKDKSGRFCLQPLNVAEELSENRFLGLTGYIHAPKDHHGIFFLRTSSGAIPARLVGSTFHPINENFPTKNDCDSTLYLPTGEVLGIGGFIGSRVFYRMDTNSGLFSTFQIDGTNDFSRVRSIAWSTPLNAPLLTFGGGADRRDGQVFSLEGDVARSIEELNQWVTHITDFPELQLTVLLTEYLDTLFVIDADKNIHRLTDLNLGEGTFIKSALLLNDPHRILMVAKEAMGPVRGLYLLQIEKTDGVWRPSSTQDWTNLTREFPTANSKGVANVKRSYDSAENAYFIYGQKYSDRQQSWLGRIFGKPWMDAAGLYRVGTTDLIELNKDDPSVLEDLPRNMQSFVNSKHTLDRRIILSDLGVSLEITNNSLEVITANSRTYIPEGSDLLWPSGRTSVKAFSLKNRTEALLLSDGQFFMLRDRNLAEADACNYGRNGK